MAMKLEQKQIIVAEVSDIAKSSVSLIAADYRGIPVPAMTELRTKARDNGVYLRVVRNTLARRAFKDTEFECTHDALTGPMMLAFSREEPGAAARLLKDFKKANPTLEVVMIALGGKMVAPSQLDAVATLPTKDEAISRLMSVMQAPITKFVRTLAATPEKLVRTLDAVREQKASQS